MLSEIPKIASYKYWMCSNGQLTRPEDLMDPDIQSGFTFLLILRLSPQICGLLSLVCPTFPNQGVDYWKSGCLSKLLQAPLQGKLYKYLQEARLVLGLLWQLSQVMDLLLIDNLHVVMSHCCVIFYRLLYIHLRVYKPQKRFVNIENGWSSCC